MELHDNAIIYHTEYQTTKKMIEKLKNINITVTKLENELIKIHNNTEEEISKVDITLNNFGIDVIYGNSITRLKKLQSIIDNYNFYFQINNLVNLLELNLKDDITIEELNGYINDIKIYLSKIKTSSTIDYSDEEVIINKLYDIVYKIIKKEIILTNNSTLLEYIQKSNTDINYIDTRVRKELNTVYSKNILNRKYQIDSLGIYANYADLLLIKEIVSITNKEITSKLSREEIIKLKRLKEEYESNKEKIKDSEIDSGKK